MLLWAQVLFNGSEYANLEMVWFTSRDPKACSALAQVEIHTGPIAQELAVDMPGTDSYYVDERKLLAHPEAAVIAKCAGIP